MNENPSLGRGEEDLLRSAQSILFARERERLRVLEEEIAAYQANEATIKLLQEKITQLEEKLYQVERANEDQLLDLQTNITILNYKNFGRSESLLDRLSPIFSRLIGKRIEEDREEMAEAFSPIMGEAIRNQIRNSRQDMVDAIYPIIGESVQKSVAETLRELQRNIDARLKQTTGSIGRQLQARLRGVSSSELTLRDAIPFEVRQLFFIQHGTGLVLSSYPSDDLEFSSGMIGGMLTAIRQFVSDSFGQGKAAGDLDEIQYGDERIILQGGQHAYLAAVIHGIEPEGFHGTLHEFVSEQHVEHEHALRTYDGDPDTLPPLASELAGFVGSTAVNPQQKKPLSRLQKRVLYFFGIGIIFLIAFSCFYLQFTLALLPIAFPGPTATVTSTTTATEPLQPTETAVFTPTPTPNILPTKTPTSTPTLTPQYTLTHTATPTNTEIPAATSTLTATATLAATATATPISALMSGNVYALAEPGLFTARTGLISGQTAVTILAVFDEWVKIQWVGANGLQEGWVLLQWVELREQIPDYLITPTATIEP